MALLQKKVNFSATDYNLDLSTGQLMDSLWHKPTSDLPTCPITQVIKNERDQLIQTV
jgi:hypothetical protein